MCMTPAKELSDLNTAVLAVSSNPPEQNAASRQTRRLPFRLLSDVNFANVKRFHSFDDFEERAPHSALLIDGEGQPPRFRPWFMEFPSQICLGNNHEGSIPTLALLTAK